MNPNDFTSRAPGEIVADPRGYHAFVPHPLPPRGIELSWGLVTLLSEADRALAQLSGVARTLPDPHLLVGPFVRREAVLSSRIEGTRAGVEDVVLFEASERADSGDVREVAAYVRAIEYGVSRMSALPMSLRLIREIHEVLMDGSRGAHLTPGEFRRSQNWIGPAGCTLTDATFVPPPADRLMECLASLETFLHAPSELPPLVRLATIHYQFEAIHPFLDGNGRVGRLLLTLLLQAWGLLPYPILSLSAFFEADRPDYYRHLLAVSREGAWDAWLCYFLRGVREQSEDASQRAGSLIALWRSYRDRLQTARSSGLLLRLTDRLLSQPAATAAQVASELTVTPRTAQLLINRLVDERILTEVSGQRWGRLYAAREILAVIGGSGTERPSHRQTDAPTAGAAGAS